MKHFVIGEKVKFYQEVGEGKVIQVLPNEFYLVVDENHFERKYKADELIKIQSESYNLSKINPSEVKKRKETIKPKRTSKKSRGNVPKVDLHIENLLDSHKNMTNGEILNLQMRAFMGFFYNNIREGATKLIVIHGVGEGVLRNEICTFLDKYRESIQYCDASYQEYGQGATEVTIYPTIFKKENDL